MQSNNFHYKETRWDSRAEDCELAKVLYIEGNISNLLRDGIMAKSGKVAFADNFEISFIVISVKSQVNKAYSLIL